MRNPACLSINVDLIRLRVSAGLTHVEVARKLTEAGIKTAAITFRNWEIGTTRIPYHKWLKVLWVLKPDRGPHLPVRRIPPLQGGRAGPDRRVSIPEAVRSLTSMLEER